MSRTEKTREELLAEVHRYQEMAQECQMVKNALKESEERYSALLNGNEANKALVALRVSDERFNEALQSSRHVLYRRNVKADQYDYISPYIEELTGYPYEVFRQYRWVDIAALMHPEDKERVLGQIEEGAGKRQADSISINLEYRLKKANGDYCWLNDWTTVNFDSTGLVESLVGSVYDITNCKNAEIELRESEERYRGLVELSPEAIFIYVDGKFVFTNAAGAKLLGAMRPDEIYGREVLEFIHPDYRESVRQRMLNTQQGKSNPLAEQLFVRLDGSIVPIEVASAPFSYHGKRAIQVVVRDISERKKMQDELLKAQKLESLGVLAGGIAHDFNNFLTGILGNLSLARPQLDPSHKITKRIEECEKAAIQASELARQLLTFARGGEPVKKLITPSPLIRDAVSFALRGSNTRSTIELADDLRCIEADEGQLSQVLHNLLFNAVQAMPGGGEVTVRAVNETLDFGNPHLLPPGEYVRLFIEDRGCGISRENLARIFDPYFTTKPQGTGLGLASAYSIIKRHGGTVEVSSSEGVGSNFSVHLPASPDTLMKAEEERRKAAEMAGNGRVLVMDDEEFIREVATEILEFLGYEAESCAAGREAVARFRAARECNAPYAAVILDLTVPGRMGGKEAAALILEIDPAAVLIVSSGYSNDPVVANFRKYGFSGAIPKPFTLDTLARELERLVPNHKKTS